MPLDTPGCGRGVELVRAEIRVEDLEKGRRKLQKAQERARAREEKLQAALDDANAKLQEHIYKEGRYCNIMGGLRMAFRRSFGHTSGRALMEILQTGLWPQTLYRFEVLAADAIHCVSRHFYRGAEAAVQQLLSFASSPSSSSLDGLSAAGSGSDSATPGVGPTALEAHRWKSDGTNSAAVQKRKALQCSVVSRVRRGLPDE